MSLDPGGRFSFPTAVAEIYQAVEEPEAAYPGREFKPNEDLIGSLRKVIAAEALGLTLHLIPFRFDEVGKLFLNLDVRAMSAERGVPA